MGRVYKEIDHELLLRNFEAGDSRFPGSFYKLEGGLKKIDFNQKEAVGSDYGGANWDYPEAGYERRRQIEAEHKLYVQGFWWTLANSPRVPKKIRKQAASWGLSKDEFKDNTVPFAWNPYSWYWERVQQLLRLLP